MGSQAEKESQKMIENLEQRLRKLDPPGRKRLLQGIYMQLVPSDKGKRKKGTYRNYVEAGEEDPTAFLSYLVNKLTDYGFSYHARKLRARYTLSDAVWLKDQ